MSYVKKKNNLQLVTTKSQTMETLKYKVITSEKQYDEYCKILEELVFGKAKNKHIQDEIDLLTVLIEKWDKEHSIFRELDPVELLHSFMMDHQLKAKDLADILNVNKSLVSEILNYKKSMSKEIIRKLSSHFKVTQEAFNRPYKWKKSSRELAYA